MNEREILRVISEDAWMMGILRTAAGLHLPDWMIGAGFVRNKVWDHLHGFDHEKVPTSDIDLIYLDRENSNEAKDIELSEKMRKETGVNWEIVNQAYTHDWHKRSPYKDAEEALGDWVETPTCVAVSLDKEGKLRLHAPHGIDDLVNLIVRRNLAGSDTASYVQRVTSKRWQEKWPKLKIVF